MLPQGVVDAIMFIIFVIGVVGALWGVALVIDWIQDQLWY